MKVRDVTRALEEDEEAIEFHIEGLKAENLPVPRPHSSSTYLDVSA